MARFTGALTQGLMNPTYAGQLSQAAGMLGGLGGDLRKQRLMGERASALREEADPRKRLEMMLQQARTPAEVLAAQQAIAQFDQQAAQESRAQAVEQRAQTNAEYVTQDRATAAAKAKDDKAKDLAKAQLSAMAQQRDRARAQGNDAKADKIQSNMMDIAGGSRVEMTKWAEEPVDATNRYMNIGDGKVFDTQAGEIIAMPEGEEGSVGPELAPKDFLSNIRQEQKDSARWKPESYQQFLTDIPTKGVFASAQEHLTAENQTDMDADAKALRNSIVSGAGATISAIDELLAIAPDGGFADASAQALFSWIPASEEKSVANAVKTIEASVAFDKLEDMRKSSKLGASGLGALSEKELDLLKADIASLDPTSRDFKRNLMKVRKRYQRIIEIEHGPASGSPNFKKGPDGVTYYRDTDTGLVYNYDTNEVVPR